LVLLTLDGGAGEYCEREWGGERWYGEERDAVDGERVGADGDVYASDEQGIYCDGDGDGEA
jgi:hypothetical protein